MELNDATRLLLKAERKLNRLQDQLGVLRCEGARGMQGERYFSSLVAVLNELRSVRNRIKLVQFEIYCVEERRNPPVSKDPAVDITAIAKELGLFPEAAPELESPIDLMWSQIESVHRQFVELQFEGRTAYGESAAGNPLPPRPIEITEAARLLTRMSAALGKAQLSIAAIRESDRRGKLPAWLEIHAY